MQRYLLRKRGLIADFAPFYYNLGLIERQGVGTIVVLKEYAQKAYELNKIDKYKTSGWTK